MFSHLRSVDVRSARRSLESLECRSSSCAAYPWALKMRAKPARATRRCALTLDLMGAQLAPFYREVAHEERAQLYGGNGLRWSQAAYL
jgi:hypothetical protein